MKEFKEKRNYQYYVRIESGITCENSTATSPQDPMGCIWEC